MKILTSTDNLNISLNIEQDFKTDLGWEEGALQMEEQILSEIINPIENYETVRYIHKPYTSDKGVEQTDIWFQFYFLTGSTYVNDYEPTGLSNRENALMLKQTTESFFRLEFFKTPNGVKPDRTNRKLVFAKNLSLPLGEKYFHTDFNDYIFLPVFMGSNYRNKENMYLFWFQDESPFSGTTITGNTFWMTAKFYNAEDGGISDFVNKPNFTDIVYDGRVGKSGTPIKFYEKKSTDSITEYEDLYYKVTIDKSDYSYMVERDVQNDITLTPTPTPTPTPTTGGGGVTNTPTPTPTSVTPTPTPTGPTPTPTPTAVPLPGCGSIVTGEYTGSTNYNYPDRQLDFTGVPNGSTISFTCTANNRPNNISIRTALTVIESTGWFGNSSGYDSGDYWYPTEGTGPITKTITYDNTKTYYIDTLTAPALDAPNEESDYWEVNISCAGVVTPTPLPPVATFSVSNGQNTSSSGTGSSTFAPTITVTNGTVTIRLRVTVQTGYQGDTTITIPGGGSFSPTTAQGYLDTTFVDFTLGVGTYTNVVWEVNAISQGEMTVATSTLTQV